MPSPPTRSLAMRVGRSRWNRWNAWPMHSTAPNVPRRSGWSRAPNGVSVAASRSPAHERANRQPARHRADPRRRRPHRGGAFKFRGACNAVWALSDAQAAHGVVTHSSGNHGNALALAAATRGIAAHVVVPEGAVRAKVEAIERAGAILHRCAPTQ